MHKFNKFDVTELQCTLEPIYWHEIRSCGDPEHKNTFLLLLTTHLHKNGLTAKGIL